MLSHSLFAPPPAPCSYKHLVGKQAVVPMSGGRRIAIIADEYVDREFGTGALKITPGGRAGGGWGASVASCPCSGSGRQALPVGAPCSQPFLSHFKCFASVQPLETC